jgi:hypothetical protein
MTEHIKMISEIQDALESADRQIAQAILTSTVPHQRTTSNGDGSYTHTFTFDTTFTSTPRDAAIDRRYAIARELGWADLHNRDGVLVGCPPPSAYPPGYNLGDDIPVPHYEEALEGDVAERQQLLLGSPDETPIDKS